MTPTNKAAKKAPAKKTATKKTATKKAPAKKAPAKKTATTKTPAKKTATTKTPAKKNVALHGVALIDAVIATVQAEGLKALGTCGLPPRAKAQPVPAEVLEKLTFPGGKPLSPSLKRWLAHDASWLDWFDDPTQPVFKPKKLGEYAIAEYDMDWGYGDFEVVFDGDCYPLHFGCDSRRFLYVGEPDSAGEYPVLLLDTDDMPYIGVEYPGIDVYLADSAGIIDLPSGCYGDAIKDKVYGPRMKEHAERYFGGRVGVGMEECSVEDGKLVFYSFDDIDDD